MRYRGYRRDVRLSSGGFCLGAIIATGSIDQAFTVDAAEHPARRDVHAGGAGDVGVQRIADRQHALNRQVRDFAAPAGRSSDPACRSSARRRRVPDSARASEPAHSTRTPPRITCRSGLAQIIGRWWRAQSPQHVLEFVHVGGIAMIVRTGVQHEVGVGRVVPPWSAPGPPSRPDRAPGRDGTRAGQVPPTTGRAGRCNARRTASPLVRMSV